MPHKYNEIEGWFDFQLLYDRMVEEAPNDATFIEVGSWKGKSACYMAELIKESGKNILLYCVDTWTGNVFGDGTTGDSLPIFKANLENAGFRVDGYYDWNESPDDYTPEVTVIPVDSLEAVKLFADNTIQFIFLDGNHTYPYVKNEIEAWLPKVKTGGYVGGHDFPDDNVARGVREALGVVEPIANAFEPDVKASYLYKKA